MTESAKQSNQTPRRVLSGMRTTGALHLGNYHGALKNWLTLQDEYDCFFFAADIHALTTDYASPEVIKQNTHDMLIDWLAAGLDPKKATIFIQSHLHEHAEFHLLLSMITPLSWLERVPTYKDQKQKLKDKDLSTYGFLGYPLLQSADILIYLADFVPVGEDQVPHVELTREIARRFNHLYGKHADQPILREPKALLTKTPILPGLDGQKMSKSYGNTIMLREDPKSIERKIRTMPTDPARIRRTDPGDPKKCPVWGLHQVYADDALKDWVCQGCRSASIGCVQCKQPLIDAVLKELAPIQERAQYFIEHPEVIREIIQTGDAAARAVAQPVIRRVYEAMGIDPS